MIPRELEAEIAELKAHGYHPRVELEGSRIHIVFEKFQLGPAYNPQETDLLVYTSTAYPAAAFDMFWVHPDVRLKNGGIPQAADSMEVYLGRTWRRFSWHLNRAWIPGKDTLGSWIAHVEDRFSRGN